jgi:hypothetical protein
MHEVGQNTCMHVYIKSPERTMCVFLCVQRCVCMWTALCTYVSCLRVHQSWLSRFCFVYDVSSWLTEEGNMPTHIQVCMSVCMWEVQVCIYACKYVGSFWLTEEGTMPAHIHVCMYACGKLRYVCMHVCMWELLTHRRRHHASTHSCMYVCMWEAQVCMYACVYVGASDSPKKATCQHTFMYVCMHVGSSGMHVCKCVCGSSWLTEKGTMPARISVGNTGVCTHSVSDSFMQNSYEMAHNVLNEIKKDYAAISTRLFFQVMWDGTHCFKSNDLKKIMQLSFSCPFKSSEMFSSGKKEIMLLSSPLLPSHVRWHASFSHEIKTVYTVVTRLSFQVMWDGTRCFKSNDIKKFMQLSLACPSNSC